MSLKPIRCCLALCALLFTQALAQAQVQNGDDVFDVGDALRVYDEIEYSEALQPTQTAAWAAIQLRLQALETKLPQTGRYVRSYFERGRMLWWLVNARLKDRPASEPSDVVITYEREQASLFRNGVVLLRRDIWERLNAQSQAVLMFHQAMLSAIGEGHVTASSQIRALTGLLLINDIQNMDAVNVARFAKQFIGANADSSRFGQFLDYDLSQAGADLGYDVAEVVTARATDLLVSLKDSAGATVAYVTTLNPHPQYRHIYFDRNYHLFTDFSQTRQPDLIAIPSSELCQGLSFANQQGWRLPSESEIFDLFQRRLAVVRYIETNQTYRMLDSRQNIGTSYNLASFSLYPRSPDLVLLSQEGSLVNVSRGYRRVTDNYPVQSPLSGTWDRATTVIYPRFFCLKSVTP